MTEEALQSAAEQMGVLLRHNRQHWMQDLIAGINELLVHDFNKLIALLYRLDVSDVRLKARLQNEPAADAAALIAELVIERQLQKLRSRQQMQRDDTDSIDEADRW